MRKLLGLAALLLLGLTVLAPASAAAAGGRTFSIDLLPSGDADGSGSAVVTVNAGRQTVCYDIQVAGIDAPQEPGPGIGSAHIHVRPGGGIAIDLDTVFTPGTGDTFVSSGCVQADRRVLVDVLRNPSQYYLNVHTEAAPLGAVQGDLG
jgi:hypothetical protein